MTRPPHADAILAIDVGNTRIGLAVSDETGLHHIERIAVRATNDWAPALERVWAAAAGRGRRVPVMASVAPQTADAFSDLAERICGARPLRVRDELPLPMPVDVDQPDEVGVDRVCAAAAAYDKLRETCAVASFGTAITIDCVSTEGRFLGGAILPGLDLSFAALHQRTAQLPLVETPAPRSEDAPPRDAFARNTHDAIVNGVLYGAVGALREIVERFATALNEWPTLVLTGGNAALIREMADFADAVVPDLTLMGIGLAYRRAARQPQS